MIFIAKDNEVSKKRTRENFELAGGEQENAIVPMKPDDVERAKAFFKGYENPPGMENGMHKSNGYHWYVPYRVEY